VLNYLVRDNSNGLYFVDYLQPIRLSIGVSRKDELAAERESINAYLSEESAEKRKEVGIIRKVEWLRSYLRKDSL
jgi:hypothetical protein